MRAAMLSTLRSSEIFLAELCQSPWTRTCCRGRWHALEDFSDIGANLSNVPTEFLHEGTKPLSVGIDFSDPNADGRKPGQGTHPYQNPQWGEIKRGSGHDGRKPVASEVSLTETNLVSERGIYNATCRVIVPVFPNVWDFRSSA